MATLAVCFVVGALAIVLMCAIAQYLATYNVALGVVFVVTFIALYSLMVKGYVTAYCTNLPLPW